MCVATLVCTNSSSEFATPLSREQLQGTIHSEISRGARFASADVMLVAETSAAVPGLVYVWGRHPSVCDHCVQPEAIVATRQGRMRVLRSPIDWVHAAAGWSPESPSAAVAACTEITATTLARAHRPVVVGLRTGSDSSADFVVWADTLRHRADSTSLPKGLSLLTFLSDSGGAMFRRNRWRLEPPRARTDSRGSWTVAFWGVQDRGAFRYRCGFPRPRWWNSSGARLVIEDSIRWPERDFGR